jgi:6-pyruvoyltetrahydropterin/6-carboxytetrahydropterin synthase
MPRNILESLVPRLKTLDKGGGYARKYRKGGRTYETSLQLAVAEILDAVRVKYRQGVLIPGTRVKADFGANGAFLLVDRQLTNDEAKELGHAKRDVFAISRSRTRSDDFDAGVRVISLGASSGAGLQTIFLDDPSFNFDYAHILPRTQKCSVMHGHTSSALVEIVGSPVDGMVVDFGVAKDVIREAIRGLDHKLFISEKYVKEDADGRVTLEFETVHGPFVIEAPKKTTVLLEGEATVENLARELLSRIVPGLPENVSAVGIYVYEGLNKGTHLLAQVHSREVERSRRKQ